MATVKDCLAKLVKTGTVTQAAAVHAEALWRRYQGKFSLDMPPARADAAAALQAARELQAISRERKNSVALQVQRQTAVEREAMQHPWGPAAGGMAVLTRDIYRLGGENVDTRVEWARKKLFSLFDTAMEHYGSRLAGLKKDTVGAWQMVGELFGVDSGNQAAKLAAKGWQDATEWGAKYVQSAGKIFEEMENWRLPQFWNGERVRGFGQAQFVKDITDAVQSGGLRVFDKERLEFATDPARINALIEKAARDIVTEAGSAPVFSKEMRTFHFEDGKKGFEAFKLLQEKYGAGQDVMSVLSGHLNSMAREIGLVDVLGPQHAATAATLAKNARAWEKSGKAGQGKVRVARALGQESASAIERTYAVQSGEANGVENAAWGGFLGAMRSLMTASSLGSAIVPAFIGDSVTMALAARANGIGPIQVIAHAIKALAGDSQAGKQAAAHLLVSGHAMSDHAIGAMRYADQTGMPELVRKVSDTVIRLSGLNAWTEGAKKAFTMDMLNHIAANVGHDAAHVEAPLQAFLKRYRITPSEWDHLRALPLYDFRGAKYFDSSRSISDPVARKLFEGILEERAFGVLEPDSRIRGFTTQGQRAGTISGELARAGTMFQSFSMTMIMTHLHALAIRDGLSGNRAANAIAFFGLHILAGAAIVQARQILQGKDPIGMSQPKFWAQAALQGGGAGFFGDLVGGVTQAADRTVIGKFSGPLGGLVDDSAQFVNAVAHRQPGAVGKGVNLLRHVTPGQNLWFSRLATDRLLFDQIQRWADPNYAQSFARREQRAMKEYGQGTWWRQGEILPDRAPGFGGNG
jgi:hypothetical protein